MLKHGFWFRNETFRDLYCHGLQVDVWRSHSLTHSFTFSKHNTLSHLLFLHFIPISEAVLQCSMVLHGGAAGSVAALMLQGPLFNSNYCVEFHTFSLCLHGLSFASPVSSYLPKHAGSGIGYAESPLGVNVHILWSSNVTVPPFLPRTQCYKDWPGSTTILTKITQLLNLNE